MVLSTTNTELCLLLSQKITAEIYPSSSVKNWRKKNRRLPLSKNYDTIGSWITLETIMPRPPAPFDPKRDKRKEKDYEKVLELPVPMPDKNCWRSQSLRLAMLLSIGLMMMIWTVLLFKAGNCLAALFLAKYLPIKWSKSFANKRQGDRLLHRYNSLDLIDCPAPNNPCSRLPHYPVILLRPTPFCYDPVAAH